MEEKLRNGSIYFSSRSSSTKKTFTVNFPHEVIYSLEWDAGEIGKLKEYEMSDKISDKLLMLAMIAEKVEK